MKKIKALIFLVMGTSFSASNPLTNQKICAHYFAWPNQNSCREIVTQNPNLSIKHTEACSEFWVENEIPCLQIAHELTPAQIKACVDFHMENQIPCLYVTNKWNLRPKKIKACVNFHKDNQIPALTEMGNPKSTTERATSCSSFEKENQVPCLSVANELNLSPQEIQDCQSGGWLVDEISCLQGKSWWEVLEPYLELDTYIK